jgi:enoyl-CoA hydratase/carnithine racemase
MLNGDAFGAGYDLAIACDSRIGVDNILMGMPPARLGVIHFPEGLQRFIQIIGLSRTKELFITDRYYEGPRAFKK